MAHFLNSLLSSVDEYGINEYGIKGVMPRKLMARFSCPDNLAPISVNL